MKTRSNGPASAGSAEPAANASRAGRLTTTIRSSAIPAWRHQPRASSVRERSGSIVTIVPSAGWPSAMPQGRVADTPCRPRRSGAGRRPGRTGPGPASRSRIGIARPARRPPRSPRARVERPRRRPRSSRGRRRSGRSRGPCSSTSTSSSDQQARRRSTARRRRSCRPRSTPTLMYSSPVADSIDRVRAVWIAAHDTTSGKTRPTMRRSQTNRAHGPVSGANGPPPEPPPSGDRDDEEDELEGDDDEQHPGEQDERRLGQLRRDEVPVARGSSPRRRRRWRRRGARLWPTSGSSAGKPPPQPSAPSDERADPGDHPGDPEPRRPPAAGQRRPCRPRR